MNTNFSAGASTLGYLHQARYALHLLLNNREEAQLSIERWDDVAFEEEGTPYELLQLKHHRGKDITLTDSSDDLWRTLRIWSVNLKQKKISLPETLLTLITTSRAADGSIAALLRPGNGRNSRQALELLLQVTSKSKNKALESYFQAFSDLSQQQKELLVDSIRILDSSPNITDTALLIKKHISLAVRKEHLEGLYERLEGWWFDKVIRHLTNESTELLVRFEVHDKIRDIAEQFKPDTLPIDFLDAEPPGPVDAQNDSRMFVKQLREIALKNRPIEQAIRDYYRAFEQRARWAREDLLISDELEKYERKLVDEWERFCDACLDDLTDGIDDDIELQKCGRKIFQWMNLIADLPIRPMVTDRYVMRGSYHILANHTTPRVWWHPKFIERLEALLVISKG